MAEYTLTSKYNLKKPNINGSEGLWGIYINENFDIIDSAILQISGAIADSVDGVYASSDVITLTQLDLNNKYITTTKSITAPDTVQLIPSNGIPMMIDDDFDVTGNRVGWDGKSLENILEVNDKIRIIYF